MNENKYNKMVKNIHKNKPKLLSEDKLKKLRDKDPFNKKICSIKKVVPDKAY